MSEEATTEEEPIPPFHETWPFPKWKVRVKKTFVFNKAVIPEDFDFDGAYDRQLTPWQAYKEIQ